MGGRGKTVVVQMTIERDIKESIFKKDIEERHFKVKEKIRKQESGKGVGSSGGGGKSLAKILKKCACCHNYSLHIGIEYEECLICGWIDDKYQNKHPDSTEGKNPLSLNEHKTQYLENINKK